MICVALLISFGFTVIKKERTYQKRLTGKSALLQLADGNKKSSPDKSEELTIFLRNIMKLESDLSVAHFRAMELAPYHAVSVTGCQGFKGPFPSAFLDK
jgi:hypothetical protein